MCLRPRKEHLQWKAHLERAEASFVTNGRLTALCRRFGQACEMSKTILTRFTLLVRFRTD